MKRNLLFAISIVFSLVVSMPSIAQTSISDIINNYSVVDSIYPTKDTIQVADVSGFSDGDTIMVYQVKGAEAYTDTTTQEWLFGVLRDVGKMNNVGKYEIILIQNILSGNRIRLKAALDKGYDLNQPIQVIRVPSYKSASIDATLTCKAWDGSTGGVLALMVSDTLFMNANIDVSGKGFRGAAPFERDGTCASTDPVLYKSYYFDETADVSAGYKGEGITEFNATYRRGLGRWATGGGGGNGRYAGGGGGGNYGNGGIGGAEDITECSTTYFESENWKGLGGNDGFGCGGLPDVLNDSTFIMGGGGGSGTYFGSLTASNGGNGGGIVILMVKNLKTNGNSIIADGADVTAVATASAGGGGAGGTVGFDVDTVIGSSLSVLCNGGNGGNVQFENKSGPGGGGGGGVIFWKKTRPANVSSQVNEGDKGKIQELLPGTINGHHATPGNFGSEKIFYDVPLTGFLFNYILDNQTICMDDTPEKILGSYPRGGDGSFNYTWQESTDNSSWSDIGGAISRDYQPPALNDTIFYRRVVTSAGIADTSYSIKIKVQKSIENNVLSWDDIIICINNEGDTITGTTVTVGGEGSNFNYNWQLKTDDGSWNSAAALEDTVFLPGVITDTTYVRRIVSSGACFDTTTNVEIIGLPLISNNILDPDQEICYDEIPALIKGNMPDEGDGSYLYQWQKRTNSSTWSDITGATGKDYQPPALIDTTYYKRFVYSDDCEDESPVHTITVLPSIISDFIVDPTTPFDNCYGTQTDVIDASEPEGGRGAGTYNYQWEESTDAVAWSDIVDNSTNQDYQSVPLTSKIYFRRHVVSGACEHYTDTLEINILELPIATITDFEDTICSGEEVTLVFDINSGMQPYDLTYSNSNDLFTENALVLGVNNILINPTTNQEQQIYNYTITNVVDDNGCEATDTSGLTKIVVYGIPESYAGPETADTCSLNYKMKAVKTLGDGIWSQISETGATIFNNNTDPNTQIEVDIAGEYTYRWKEENWHCKDSAEVQVALYQPVTGVDAGVDTSLFFIDKYELKGTYDNPDNVADTTTLWEILLGSGNFEDKNSKITNITNLVDDTKEGILIQWTVNKGSCAPKVDSLVIDLRPIFTPTGFTPNGDGKNDVLKFNGLQNAAEYEIIIYNRWGTQVYRIAGNSNDLEWDGKNMDGKDLPEDTYFYLLNVKNKNGTSASHKGYFIIKRN